MSVVFLRTFDGLADFLNLLFGVTVRVNVQKDSAGFVFALFADEPSGRVAQEADANQHDQSREQAGEQHPAPVVFAQRKDAVDEV